MGVGLAMFKPLNNSLEETDSHGPLGKELPDERKDMAFAAGPKADEISLNFACCASRRFVKLHLCSSFLPTCKATALNSLEHLSLSLTMLSQSQILRKH